LLQRDGKLQTQSVSESTYKPGTRLANASFFGWSFLKGREHELVPGTWTQKVFVHGKEVVSMIFEVLPK
jgi:hypothetical protein